MVVYTSSATMHMLVRFTPARERLVIQQPRLDWISARWSRYASMSKNSEKGISFANNLKKSFNLRIQITGEEQKQPHS